MDLVEENGSLPRETRIKDASATAITQLARKSLIGNKFGKIGVPIMTEAVRPVDAIATALVFFHKFYTFHSFRSHERFVIGSACLFVASKVEESPKRVETVVGKCYGVWTNREPFGESEKPFKRLREKILIGERCVLHTLGFQLSVEHPYSKVMYFLKALFAQGKGADGGRGPDKALNRQLTQAAMSLVNDSLLTTVCLQYRPDEVAAAVVYIAYMFMGLPRLEMTALQTDETVLAAICDTVLSLYDEDGAGHATLLASNMREQLRKRIGSPVALSTPSSSGTPAAAIARTPPAMSPRPTPSPSPLYRYSSGDDLSAMERERGTASSGRNADATPRHNEGDPRRRRSGTSSTRPRSKSPSPKNRRGWSASTSSAIVNGAEADSGREALLSSGGDRKDTGTKRPRVL